MSSGTVLAENDGFGEDEGVAGDARDRRKVADEIEVEPVVERRVEGIAGRGEQQGVAVRRRARDRAGSDVAAGAGSVLDHELLAQPLGEPSADEARSDVGYPAGRIADEETNRPRRIGLRAGKTRHGRKPASTHGETE